LKGYVDESLRALIDVAVRSHAADQSVMIRVWIDTAFDGFFVFPRTMIEQLGLHQEAMTQAILADGRTVTLESFVCYVDWFGEIVAAQVIANHGILPLLGTEFLANHRLVADYTDKTVSID
jgi:clan AA aspartic protease